MTSPARTSATEPTGEHARIEARDAATAPRPPINLAEHEALGRAALDASALAYFGGGAGDGLTMAANRAAWDRIALLPRVLRDLSDSHTRVTLLGRTLAHPILVAPVAYQRLAHPHGELATALAASAQQAGLVLSTQSSVRLETIAEAVRRDADRGPLWFQLYLQRDPGLTLELVRRAEAAGYEALVLTVDAPVHGARDEQRRAGFVLPPGITAANLPSEHRDPVTLDALLRAAPTWADVEWLRGQTRLPILLKGILHPDDAREAERCGAAGVIVSNHGGRTLDTAVATAHALPAVADALGGRLALLADGGIRRGTDVLKALALGAHAVLVGRPVVWGLAHGGAAGVAQVLRLLRDEFTIAMALCGVRQPSAISSQILVQSAPRLDRML